MLPFQLISWADSSESLSFCSEAVLGMLVIPQKTSPDLYHDSLSVNVNTNHLLLSGRMRTWQCTKHSITIQFQPFGLPCEKKLGSDQRCHTGRISDPAMPTAPAPMLKVHAALDECHFMHALQDVPFALYSKSPLCAK